MKLLVIFPCYNEEAVLDKTIPPFFAYFEGLIKKGKISPQSRICFVDDGSKDATWQNIERLENTYVLGIKLSTNFGHQKALLAGLETYSGQYDAYVTMDVDLQDDYALLPQMVDKLKEGKDIVYGARGDRSSDSFFKRITATIFYGVFEKLGGKSVKNAADFRMINQKALSAFLQYGESHLFLRAIFPSMGLQTATLLYTRKEREQGETKYPLQKMISFAWEGITSFSTKPLKFVLIIGILTTLFALVLFIWALVEYLLGNTIRGWFSVVTILLFFGGLQTVALGIIGEYIGKIYSEVKKRPRYIIEKEKKTP